MPFQLTQQVAEENIGNWEIELNWRQIGPTFPKNVVSKIRDSQTVHGNIVGLSSYKNDTSIILKQWDIVARKNLISVELGVQIPFHNDEISSKVMCNVHPDQEWTPTPKTISFKRAIVSITFISPTQGWTDFGTNTVKW